MPRRKKSPSLHDLKGVIDCLLEASNKMDEAERFSVKHILSAVGRRSFGPLLLIPGLIGVSPIGAIPGVPAITSLIALIVSVQMLIGQKSVWLPKFLSNRSVKVGGFRRGLRAMRPYANKVDAVTFPRMTVLTDGPAAYVIAFMCLLIALVTPLIELVPLAGIVPNAALVAFALALIAHDGLLAIFALMFTVASVFLFASFV